ncbi:hypothetical protein V5O48_009883 [Marasmius crinis-equi]|uniref:Uncharacterized protein n=1 Tax=Marasmius crinis-equi TaxID=585013 RepID=A0ABR3F9W9_9AGAR
MFKLSLFFSLFICASVLGGEIPERAETSSKDVSSSPSIFPIAYHGAAAAVQAIQENSDTRIYYQHTDNSIHQIAVNGLFTTGRVFADDQFVPPEEVLEGTPIVATSFGDTWQEIHFFFFSPGNILSEYIWKANVGFHGGPNCSECITVNQFGVQPGSKVLYVMGNPGAHGLRVGFVSAGSPSTITEAVTNGSGWQLATMK